MTTLRDLLSMYLITLYPSFPGSTRAYNLLENRVGYIVVVFTECYGGKRDQVLVKSRDEVTRPTFNKLF